MNIEVLVVSAVAAFSSLPVIAQQTPAPCGLAPSVRQLEWYNREMVAFSHLGINTFEGYVNEGDGKTGTAIFDPTALNCRQWMQTLKVAGIPATILTAKHADGPCLWPSKYTDYSAKNAAWKNGRGGAAHEPVDACEEYGLKAGIYLGLHDRHEHPPSLYMTERYKEHYAHQFGELMSDYGKIWETWWDSAEADELTMPVYRHWYKTVREEQPDCVILGTKNFHLFADVRWTGNKAGEAGDPCRAMIDSVAIRDETQYYEGLNEGILDGDVYIPAEIGVSTHLSWFYHAEEDSRVKSIYELWDIYCTSVGRNSALSLNFPPDRRGLIYSTDPLHATLLKQGIDETFSTNLLRGAKVKATNVRGAKHSPEKMLDNEKNTYFVGKNGEVEADIIFTLPKTIESDCLMIEEVIGLGHRTTEQSVEYTVDGKNWTAIPEATDKQAIGHKWAIRLVPVKAKQVRLRIQDGKACPAIHTPGVYKQSPVFRL